jgi:homoprotocatechuate degradation regulator HpaR
MGRFRPILNKHGITEQQWRIVRALIDAGRPLEPREIGSICRISSPSLAGMLARMEELRVVSRKRLDHDQRRVLVSLTAPSRSLAARMAPHIEGAYSEMEAALGPEFVEQCYVMLDQIAAALAPPADQADVE